MRQDATLDQGHHNTICLAPGTPSAEVLDRLALSRVCGRTILVSATPCALWPLWCAAHRSAAIALLKKSIFNLRVDAMKPLLGPVGSFAISGDFCLQLRDTVFGRA